MSKVTTDDCRKFLITNQEIQQIVSDRSGLTDYLNGNEAKSNVLFSWVNNGKNPKKWKRNIKYKVGSTVDLNGGNLGGGLDVANNEFVQTMRGVDPTGGIVREFWLEDTDHITIAILEKNGKLYFLDDLSD